MSILAASIGAAAGIGGNLLGSAAQSAMGYYMSKKMAKYNYDLQKKGYKEFPTAQVEGLKAAGINPMTAYGGISGATAHSQNYQPAPDSNLGTSSVSKYWEAKQNELAEKNLTSQIEVNSANAEKARKEGNAAIMNAETNRLSVGKMAPKDPGNSNWALGSYLSDNLGSLVTSGFGAKMIYDWWKNRSTKNNTVGQSKNQYIKPSNGGKNNVVKPVPTKTTTTTTTPKPKLSIKRPSVNSAASVKAAAPIIAGEVLDGLNKKFNPRAKKYKEKPINSWKDRVRWVD